MDIMLAVIAAIVLLYVVLFSKSKRQKSFPAPRGLPLIGQILFIGDNPPETFLKWKQAVGPVFELNLAGKRVIVLNDRKSMVECFSRAEFSGRKEALGIFEYWNKSSGLGILFNDVAEVGEIRHFLIKYFRDCGMAEQSKIEESICEEISMLSDRWRSTEGEAFELYGTFTQISLNNVWKFLSDKRYDYQEVCELVKHVEAVTEGSTLLSKMAHVVPWFVEKISDCVSKKVDAVVSLTQIQERYIQERQRSRIANQPRDIIDKYLDFIDVTVDPKSNKRLLEGTLAPLLRDVFLASIETVSSTMEYFIQYGILNPVVIRKLQEEIDRVVGNERKPTLQDKASMPYSMACVLETLRKSSSVPLGVPHCATADTEFRGVPIKKGTLVIGNSFAVHHDPEIWDKPYDYNPERFLNQDGSLKKDSWNKIAAFGVGKRACIGANFSGDGLFLIITQLYQQFSITPEKPLSKIHAIYGLAHKPLPGVKISVRARQCSQ